MPTCQQSYANQLRYQNTHDIFKDISGKHQLVNQEIWHEFNVKLKQTQVNDNVATLCGVSVRVEFMCCDILWPVVAIVTSVEKNAFCI